MCVLSIKVPIRKKSGNIFNELCIYIYIYIYIYMIICMIYIYMVMYNISIWLYIYTCKYNFIFIWFSIYDYICICTLYIYIYIYIYKWIGHLRDLLFFKNYLFHSYIRICFQLFTLVGEDMWRKFDFHWMSHSYGLVPHMKHTRM